nr:transposase [Saccharomonospora piscinae]
MRAIAVFARNFGRKSSTATASWSRTTRLAHFRPADLRFAYWKGMRLWSGSYFAGSVGGAPISVVRQYIEQQTRPAV